MAPSHHLALGKGTGTYNALATLPYLSCSDQQQTPDPKAPVHRHPDHCDTAFCKGFCFPEMAFGDGELATFSSWGCSSWSWGCEVMIECWVAVLDHGQDKQSRAAAWEGGARPSGRRKQRWGEDVLCGRERVALQDFRLRWPALPPALGARAPPPGLLSIASLHFLN